LQQEIQRSEESRYDHRLHGVLLVAQGMTCPEALVASIIQDQVSQVDAVANTFLQNFTSGAGENGGWYDQLSAQKRP
jgi:hypothetical protein